MRIQPLADRVLIKPAAAEEKTVGGIIIPDTAKVMGQKTKKWSSKLKILSSMVNIAERK